RRRWRRGGRVLGVFFLVLVLFVLVVRGDRGGRGQRRGHTAGDDPQVNGQGRAGQLRGIDREGDRHPDAIALRPEEVVLELDREVCGALLAAHGGIRDADEVLDFLLLGLGGGLRRGVGLRILGGGLLLRQHQR